MGQLKLIAVSELRTAKDGRNFFVATFRPGFGQRSVKRTFWEQFVRDSKTQALTDNKEWERASYEEALGFIKSGELIDGEKITAKVEKYILGENEVDTYSTVVFPDEIAEKVFENQNHPMVNEETGELIITKKKKAIIAPTEKEPAMQG